MAQTLTRTMSFQAKDLGKESTLLLIFNSQKMEGIYKTFCPVVWRTDHFPKTGAHIMKVTYTNQFAFSNVKVSKRKITDAETCMKIKTNERTNLIKEDDAIKFSDPQKGSDDVMEAWNKTGVVQNIALGIMNSEDLFPAPVLLFEDVGDGDNVTAELIPMLRAYVTSNYKETTALSSAIETPVIWERDPAALVEKTSWNLTRDTVTGHYKITEAL
ncbi:hypothetical protein EDB19DRAFT_1163041 [Suillus lakei]|nr:hypothetical protein EDB19DRAFT_1163041 [Suillus lakei]